MDSTPMLLLTCSVASSPVREDFSCSLPEVLMRTPAAMAATSTAAMKTIIVPMPVSAASSRRERDGFTSCTYGLAGRPGYKNGGGWGGWARGRGGGRASGPRGNVHSEGGA